MNNAVVNVICCIVISLCAISVMLSARTVRKVTKNIEDMTQKQIEYMNKKYGRTSVEETL